MNRLWLLALGFIVVMGGNESWAHFPNPRQYVCLAHYRSEEIGKKCGVFQFGEMQIPECETFSVFKNGQYIAYGPSCSECFSEGRSNVAWAGRTITKEWGHRCRSR